MKYHIPLVAAVLLALAGCATFEKNLNTERVLVSVGTMKVIEAGKSPTEMASRAQRVVDIATEAKTWLSGEAVTVDVLKDRVMDRINALDLQPSDRLLAGLLVDAVVDELKTRVVGGVKVPVPPEQLTYQINTVLSWVIDTAEVYR